MEYKCPQIGTLDKTPYLWIFITTSISLWIKIIAWRYSTYSQEKKSNNGQNDLQKSLLEMDAFNDSKAMPSKQIIDVESKQNSLKHNFKKIKQMYLKIAPYIKILLLMHTICCFWSQLLYDMQKLNENNKIVCYFAIFTISPNYNDLLTTILLCFIHWSKLKKARKENNKCGLMLIGINIAVVLLWEVIFYIAPILVILLLFVLIVIAAYFYQMFHGGAVTGIECLGFTQKRKLTAKEKIIFGVIYTICIGGLVCLLTGLSDLLIALIGNVGVHHHRTSLIKYLRSTRTAKEVYRLISFFRG